jgi:hippurate hydrolase
VAAEIVTALQTWLTRRIDIFDPAVITVGTFHAGTRRNIIPANATFEATVRSFSAATSQRLAEELPRLCRGIAEAYGLTADVRYELEYPATINAPAETAFAQRVIVDVFGAERLAPMPFPDAGSEDFSRVLDEVPGCYLFLGACTTADVDNAPTNHSPLARFDDAVLVDGVLLHSELAIRALKLPVSS